MNRIALLARVGRPHKDVDAGLELQGLDISGRQTPIDGGDR